MSREKLFSVTMKDCDLDTFRSGGSGGQNVNKRDTGVRITHRASGAIGKSTEERSQLQNKQTAFTRMTKTVQFQSWLGKQLAGAGPTPEEKVEQDMRPENLLIEEGPLKGNA